MRLSKFRPMKLNLFTVMTILLCLSVFSCIKSKEEKAAEFYQKAQQAIAENKTDEAIIHLKNAIQNDSSHVKAQFQLGNLYLEKDDLNDAYRQFLAVLKNDPDHLKASKLVGMAAYRQGNFPVAVERLRPVAGSPEEDLEVLLALGNSLLNTEDIQGGMELLEKTAKKFPKEPTALISLARACLMSEKIQKARQLMEQAVNIDPENFGNRMILIGFYEQMAMREEMGRAIDKLVEDFPDIPEAYLAKIRFNIGQNQPDRVSWVIEAAKAEGVEDPRFSHILGVIEHRGGNFEKALSHFKRAVERFPDDQKSLLVLADYYLFLKNYPEAKAVFEKILGKYPELVPVQSKLVELLISEGQYEKALKEIDSIEKEGSNQALGSLLRGKIQLRKGETVAARESFSRVRDQYPESPEARYYYGLTFLDEEGYQISLVEILKALEKNPQSIRYRLALAFVHFKTEDYDRALEQLDKILADDPKNLRALFLRSEIYKRTGQPEKAQAGYRKIIELQPNALEAHLGLGDSYLQMRQFDKALDTYSYLLENAPNPTVPLERIVRVHTIQGEFDKALLEVNRQLQAAPDNLDIALLMAVVHISRKDYSEGEAYLLELIGKHPDTARPLLMLARLYQTQGNASQALSTLQDGLQNHPDNVDIKLQIARLFLSQQNYDKAIEVYEQIVSQDEKNATAANDLAYIYAEKGENLDRALRLAQIALDKMPDRPEVIDTLGWVHYKRGANSIAKGQFLKATESLPNHPLFNFHLGLVQYDQKEYRDAEQSLTKALKLGLPEHEANKSKEMLQQISEKRSF